VKKKALRPTHIKTEIKDSPGKGRGVFALKAIKKGEIIEVSPAIYIPESDCPFINMTELSCYLFGDSSTKGEWLALGHASMYNHAKEPSADWAVSKGVIIIRAVKSIKEGEEITFDYGWDDELLKELEN
jgi:SET domain-containing protein